jgi:hypothetical protein
MPLALFQFARRDDPLANRKSARLWAASLPANDALGAVEAVTSLVAAPVSVQTDVSPARAEALLELDRIADPMHTQLRAQYRQATLSEDVRERLWEVSDKQSRAFAHAYERVAEALHADVNDRSRALLHATYARLFFYTALQTRYGLFRYERWIPGRWRALHAAYSEACRQGIAAEPYSLDPERTANARTPEQEYIQILLLHRLNTGNLTPQQIDQSANWLREWAPLLGLALRQPDGDGFWLDLRQGEGLIAHLPPQNAGELLYLDVRPLGKKLHEVATRLKADALAPHADVEAVDATLDLLRRLSVIWFPQAPQAERRGERHPQHRGVTVALNWSEIASALTVSAIQRSSAPAGYHYDDYGRLRPNRGAATPAKETRRHDLNVWQVMDSSESGYRIRTSSSPAVASLRLGILLALKVEDDARWQLAILRRLKRINAEQSELGVEVISRAVALVAPRSVVRAKTGYSVDGIDIGQKAQTCNALFLPGQSRSRGGSRPSIVLPASEFTLGKAVTIAIDGVQHEVVLAPPIERTKEWVWTPLELAPRGG